jgi:hypothetical protein
MTTNELIEKIKRQSYYIDHVDAFRLISHYVDIYGVRYWDNLSIEDELLLMFNELRKPVIGPTKKCGICLERKAYIDFAVDKRISDGRCIYCRKCLQIKRQARKHGRVATKI